MATIIGGRVYYAPTYSANPHIVHCYDQSQDTWAVLPPLPVQHFGLGQINEKLVTVGGFAQSSTNILHTYDEVSCKWEQTFPSMPTSRCSVNVLSLQSALIVAGGIKPDNICTNAVEILKLDVMQWCRAAQIPVACADISLVAIGGICYALGGSYGIKNDAIFLRQVLYASIDDLLSSALAIDETVHCSAIDPGMIWKHLPDTPRYVPTAAVLAGRLLAIGGGDQPRGGTDMKEVYMYSDTAKCWMYINDLPAPRSDMAIVALSATEILVIGGYNEEYVNTVYKDTLQLEP